MAGVVAIRLDGVLRAPVGARPIPEGFSLYHALVTTYRVCVVLDVYGTAADALWLRKEGMTGFAQLHARRPLDDHETQYRRLQALGPVELVVDSDPAAVSAAMDLGITAMLFGHPRASRPEWRPDYERTPKPWDALVERVEQQRLVEPDAE